MSLFFISRLRVGVRRSSSVSLLLSKGFSTSLRQTPPCAIICTTPCGHDLGRLIVSYANQLSWTQLEKRVPMELVYNDEKTQTIGASYGWIATLKDDGILRLQDDFNPVASDIDPKRIQLPPLVTLPNCQTKIITNVSMSSPSPEDDEDCIVAVKFLGPQISFCRPAQSKPEWANMTIENPSFHSSRVMYSKKDNVFRMLGSGDHVIATLDFFSKREHFVARWYKKTKSGIAKMKTKALKLFKLDDEEGNDKLQSADEVDLFLDSCSKSEHLVEAPTGETFLVEQYRKKTTVEGEGVARMKTLFLTVYKIDDEGNHVNTRDMGDLTMFLSKSEPFCVPSSSFPGLRPNYIHFLDVDEIGHVDVGNIPFSIASVGGLCTIPPYYFPPQDIDN